MREADTLTAAPIDLNGDLISATGAVAAAAHSIVAAAQDRPVKRTVNNEQQATWIRNFSPPLSENVSCR